MSTAEYRETAPPISRLGTGGRHCPRCLFIAIGLSAALPHVGLAHVDPDRVVHDPVHDGVGMHPATEPRVPVLLLELRAEDGRGGAVPQLHQLQQHRPELCVRLVQQPLAPSWPPVRSGHCASRRGRCGRSRSAADRSPTSASGPPWSYPSRHLEPPRSLDCMAARA